MIIVLVSQEYPPETARGGIGSQTYVKAHGLAGLGHELYVISRSTDDKRHEKKEDGVCVIRIPGIEDKIPEMTEAVQWITHSVAVAQEIEALQKRISIDIIDFPEWAAEGYVYLLNRTPWKSVPVVIQLHGPLVMFAHILNWPDKDSEFYRVGTHMEASTVKLADAVYSSSNCSSQWIKDHYDANRKDIPVIHLGVDTQLFTPQPELKEEKPVIIFVGKIVPNKGVEELTDACAKLIKTFPDLQLRMIGSGEASFIEKLRKKAMRQDGTSFLDLKGYVHRDDLPAELAKASIFASPSYYEGGPGFVFLEAMACGLPVVGCTGSGVDEIVTDGSTGLLVPPEDTVVLEEALNKLLNDKDLMQSMGTNARNYVTREADGRTCLKKLEMFYGSVIASRSVSLTEEAC